MKPDSKNDISVVILTLNYSTDEVSSSINSFRSAGVERVFLLNSSTYGMFPVVDAKAKVFHSGAELVKETGGGWTFVTSPLNVPSNFLHVVSGKPDGIAYGLSGCKIMRRTATGKAEVEFWSRGPSGVRFLNNDSGDRMVDVFDKYGYLLPPGAMAAFDAEKLSYVLARPILVSTSLRQSGFRLVCLDTPWGRPVRLPTRNVEFRSIPELPDPPPMTPSGQTVEAHDPKSTRKGRTIVGLASYPARESGMLAVVAALSPQCDEMHVALNEYEGEALEKVLGKLSQYPNVHARAYVGEEDLGCQNKFRAVDLCRPDDYFLTVDDDTAYPNGYVDYMVKCCDELGGSSVVSCSGCVLSVSGDGATSFDARKYFPIHDEVRQFVQVHQVGGGNACLMPTRIGLKFTAFMFPKNSGDDEILALFCQTRNVKSFVVPHRRGWLSFFRWIRSITPLSNNDSICKKRRACVMGMRDDWRMVSDAGLTGSQVLFHIVTPFFNDPDELRRCLGSVAAQDIDRSKFRMVVVDDASDDGPAMKAEKMCRESGFARYVRNDVRLMAGGARNTGVSMNEGSEYVLFLDSDDMFMTNDALSRLEGEIRAAGNPDVMLCGFVFDSTGKTRMFNATTPEQMSELQCVAPWIRVSKTGKIPPFLENRRVKDDVTQFLLHLDMVDTVASTSFTVFRYMSGNVLGTTSERTIFSKDGLKSQFLVMSDILSLRLSKPYSVKRAVSQLRTEFRDTTYVMGSIGDKRAADAVRG